MPFMESISTILSGQPFKPLGTGYQQPSLTHVTVVTLDPTLPLLHKNNIHFSVTVILCHLSLFLHCGMSKRPSLASLSVTLQGQKREAPLDDGAR